MADYTIIGQDIVPQDLIAKITGRAKYAEDFRAEGMLFAKLLGSPMPHARVRGIDFSAALAMPGVVDVLTADEVPQEEYPFEPALTNEPRYEGEAILAVVAVDETTAADAIERINIDLEPLPFVINPLEALRPNGPNAHLDGNIWTEVDGDRAVGTLKWDQAVFDGVGRDDLPRGEHVDEWMVGDVDRAMEEADLVLEETLYHQTQTHHPMEPRTSMAYWQNGRLFMHASVQSLAQSRRGLADRLGLPLEDVVLISEYCGGGFGSKIRGSTIDLIPALLARKTGRPVMLRITRAEETVLGRARSGMMGWAKMGFRSDGRMIALDVYMVQDSGPYSRPGDYNTAANTASLNYTPANMRYRSVAVITNTPPRSAQRGPGGAQGVTMFEPMFDRAARRLGIDRLALRKLNAPGPDVAYGSSGTTLTSCFAREALQRGGELFNWEERAARSGQRTGSKVRGVGVALSPYTAGSSGWDALGVIRNDGKLYIHQGIGNLGTHSAMDTARPAAEVLGMPWDRCEIVFGNSANHVPHSSSQSGSQTTFAHSRVNHVLGEAIRDRLMELAALELGGTPADYEVANERVYRRGSPGTGLSFAEAAERAVARGGRFDGHELPEDINAMTVESATALAGQGMVVAVKDNLPHTARTYSFVVTFMEVEVDVETGMFDILDVTSVADCGTVLNPRSLAAQANGGIIQGIGIGHTQKWAIDPQWGVNLSKRIEAAKPPTILEVPTTFTFEAVGLPDPENPVGAKGIGEPPVGAGEGALVCAIEDALGGEYLTHLPLTTDKILSLADGGALQFSRLDTHL
ncbi:MAG: xanthine dehydrogenase family protein molybdopterin-binding subunit [Gemmatimonadota bacterium]